MKNINYKQKTNNVSQTNAFTMVELIFVIIILGILISLALPRINRDIRQEAADTILSAIRHTQHMALTDNRHKFDRADWQTALWQIRFSNPSGTWRYTIASNIDYNTNLDQNESVLDPLTGEYLHNISLTSKYGIDSVTINNSCKGSLNSTAMHIAFDNLGRPHRGVTQGASNDYATYISNDDCQITFGSSSFTPDLIIQVQQETGYASIVGQGDS